MPGSYVAMKDRDRKPSQSAREDNTQGRGSRHPGLTKGPLYRQGMGPTAPVQWGEQDSHYGPVTAGCSSSVTVLNGSCYCGYAQKDGHKALFIVVFGEEGGAEDNLSLNF